jgi:hypothetical protein
MCIEVVSLCAELGHAAENESIGTQDRTDPDSRGWINILTIREVLFGTYRFQRSAFHHSECTVAD